MFCSQELKGRILIKGKRLNKLDTAFNNNSTEDVDSVSEEDESAELKDEEKPKGQVCLKTLLSFPTTQELIKSNHEITHHKYSTNL